MTIKYPNLFIAGAGKSGTTSLHNLLDTHDRICMSYIKEPHYWVRLNESGSARLSERDYLKLFDCDADVLYKGESSTGYMLFPEFIPAIKSNYSHAPKFIFILRNPIYRCYSHYWWLKGIGSESVAFRKAVKADLAVEPSYQTRMAEGRYKSYFQFGLYGKWLQRFYENFESHNILILTFEDLTKNPLATANRCFEFLDLNPVKDVILDTQNETRILRFPRLYRFSRRLSKGNIKVPKPIRSLLPKSFRAAVKDNLDDTVYKLTQSNKSYPPMLESDKIWLADLYREDVSQLRNLTGMAFEQWTEFKTQK